MDVSRAAFCFWHLWHKRVCKTANSSHDGVLRSAVSTWKELRLYPCPRVSLSYWRPSPMPACTIDAGRTSQSRIGTAMRRLDGLGVPSRRVASVRRLQVGGQYSKTGSPSLHPTYRPGGTGRAHRAQRGLNVIHSRSPQPWNPKLHLYQSIFGVPLQPDWLGSCSTHHQHPTSCASSTLHWATERSGKHSGTNFRAVAVSNQSKEPPRQQIATDTNAAKAKMIRLLAGPATMQCPIDDRHAAILT
jgi:hypothetical protein